MNDTRKLHPFRIVIVYIFLIVVSYLCFFSPAFNIPWRVSSYQLLTYFNIFMIILFFKDYAQLVRRFSKIFKLLVILCVVVFLITFDGGDTTYIRRQFLFVLMDFVTPLTICIIAKRNCIEDENVLVKLLIITASIAALISCICLVNPDIHQFVRYELQNISEEDKAYDYVYRCYGLTNGYLFSYGIALGVIVGICFQYIEKYKYFWVSVPFIFIAILINARTGALIGFVSLLIYLFSNRAIHVVSTFFLGIAVIIVLLYQFREYLFSNEDALGFMVNFFLQLDSDSNQGNTINKLSEMIMVFPQDIDGWMFGYGKNVMIGVNGLHSDTGFSHDLFYGGLIYTIPKYWIVFAILSDLRKNGYKNISLVLLSAFIIADVKGPYVETEAFSITVLTYFWLMTDKRTIAYEK